MRSFSHRVGGFAMVLVLGGAGTLSKNVGAAAQSETPETVQAYYLLMPAKYDRSTRQQREEILEYSETTIDNEKGYIQYVTHLSGEVFEAALFKEPDGGKILAYNEDCDLKYSVLTKLYFLKYENGKWTDVTTQLLPIPVNSRFRYKLPASGTTIKVTDAKGRPMYSLFWKNGKFEKQ
ncbi:MAG TPA: hypothetical protein VK475_00690 [Pyrinomonadaceae bacterium]|nr:hypothetical protein [Pyrinomonadaceae bacterium]